MAKRILVAGGSMIGIGLSRRLRSGLATRGGTACRTVLDWSRRASGARGQSQRCRILCAPELKIEPTIIFALDVPHADPTDWTDA